jgi:hypothetical protein
VLGRGRGGEGGEDDDDDNGKANDEVQLFKCKMNHLVV